MTTVANLIVSGTLRLAKEPADNATLGALARAKGYTVPLIAHDYPAMTARLWNATYAALDMPCVNAMVVVDPPALGEVVRALRGDSRYLGGGCGVGCKEAILPHLDDVAEVASAMRAVNIISRSGNRLLGANTDGTGFVRGLLTLVREQWSRTTVAGMNVVVLGAGGAGSAVAFACALQGANVTIVNRTVEKAERLARDINALRRARRSALGVDAFGTSPHTATAIFRTAHVVVNTTTVGQGALADQSPLDADALRVLPTRAIVADIVLGRAPTALLRDAHARGLATQDGLPMVVEQAIDAFMIVHGTSVPRERIAQLMWDAARTRATV